MHKNLLHAQDFRACTRSLRCPNPTVNGVRSTLGAGKNATSSILEWGTVPLGPPGNTGGQTVHHNDWGNPTNYGTIPFSPGTTPDWQAPWLRLIVVIVVLREPVLGYVFWLIGFKNVQNLVPRTTQLTNLITVPTNQPTNQPTTIIPTTTTTTTT